MKFRFDLSVNEKLNLELVKEGKLTDPKAVDKIRHKKLCSLHFLLHGFFFPKTRSSTKILFPNIRDIKERNYTLSSTSIPSQNCLPVHHNV